MPSLAIRTAAEHVADYLRDAILGGRLQPGGRIRQADVAALLGVSQGVVREAFRQLQSEGLATLEPRKGARVAVLTLAEIREIYELRDFLEPLLLSAAAPHVSDQHLDQLQDLTGRMREAYASRSSERFIQLNFEFHFVLYRAAPGRTWALRMLATLIAASMPYHALFQFAVDWSQTLAEHQEIIEACRRREWPRVIELHRVHRRRTLGRLQELLSQSDPQPACEERDDAHAEWPGAASRNRPVSSRPRDEPSERTPNRASRR